MQTGAGSQLGSPHEFASRTQHIVQTRYFLSQFQMRHQTFLHHLFAAKNGISDAFFKKLYLKIKLLEDVFQSSQGNLNIMAV